MFYYNTFPWKMQDFDEWISGLCLFFLFILCIIKTSTDYTKETLMSLLFLHGLGQTSAAWEKTLSCLPEIRAVCPDLSGFLSDDNTSYETLYYAFSRFCDMQEKPISFVGLSLGSVLALNYAIDHPNNMSAMILAAPQYEMPKVLLKFQNMIFRFFPDKAFANIGLCKQDFISLTNSMTNLNFTGSLEKIHCPVIVICGEHDRANRKAAIHLAELLPNAKLTIVADAGHEVNLDAPEKLAGIIQTHLL